jgi:hypothetical protein
MLKTGESEEDIEQMLIRGEDMGYKEAWDYIKMAKEG